LTLNICPWCCIRNPAFPQDSGVTPQATQPQAPSPLLEQPATAATLVKSTQEDPVPLVTPAVQQIVYAPQPSQKSKSPPKKTNLGQFGQPHRSVTTTPAAGTHVSQTRVFSQQQALSASSKPPQLPLDHLVVERKDTKNLPQTQNTLTPVETVEFFDIMWRFYIIDYDVDPPHRLFTNVTPWPANMTLRETYEDEFICFFEFFVELRALNRVQHSGSNGETYGTMIGREFKARGIKERLQIYRKVPSADDQSEITSSWDSFDGKMLSKIVLQANETIYKPMPKGSRKTKQTVDYYIFDVGIIREQQIREPSVLPEEFSDLDECLIPDSQDDNNNNLFSKDTQAPSDDDTQSVHTVSSRLTNLSLRVQKTRDEGRAEATVPTCVPTSTSAPVPAEIQRQDSIHRKRAVSGTAPTSSSKRVISRSATPVAPREGRYQTRSKGQQ